MRKQHYFSLAIYCFFFTPWMETLMKADEGMWLMNDPPRELLKKKYNFNLTEDWLLRAQRASVRFNNGGSGGFVSANGLIVTNHHIAADCLQKLSTKKNDYLKNGFYAETQKKELRCPDLELNVLQEIVDVTTIVKSAVKSGMSAAEAFSARQAIISSIEKESLEETGLRSDVVTLYQGGMYHLYRYKKYTDVRLVFAPEEHIAFFGGNTDNFKYPRYCLDVAFLRAYEKGKPAKTPHYFRWSKVGPKSGDLVFVTGHPGTTNRLETLAKLIHRRDVTLPYLLYRLRTLEAALSQFSERGPQQERMARTALHRVANARKAYTGMYAGLLNPATLQRKGNEEKTLIKKFMKSDKDADKNNPWLAIEQAQAKLTEFEKEYQFLEKDDAFYSELFDIARHIVRLTEEVNKPNAKRLREYRDSNLESLKFQLYSPAPIHPELERVRLATSLSFLAENMGGEHPIVKKIFAGKGPMERATELVNGCTLIDPKARKDLVEGGIEAVKKSKDPMMQLALQLDPQSRKIRKRYETEVQEPERQAYSKIADVRFSVFGNSVAPDATFTLRLAFGVVGGYEEEGQEIPFATTFGGVFERAELQQHREPFELPKRWMEGKDKVNLKTPFDFVSTADTIGGNSGSPVLNRKGELIGINFDRNRHGLVRNFVYTDHQARHISVHGLAVIEALSKLYSAQKIVDELQQ